MKAYIQNKRIIIEAEDEKEQLIFELMECCGDFNNLPGNIIFDWSLSEKEQSND